MNGPYDEGKILRQIYRLEMESVGIGKSIRLGYVALTLLTILNIVFTSIIILVPSYAPATSLLLFSTLLTALVGILVWTAKGIVFDNTISIGELHMLNRECIDGSIEAEMRRNEWKNYND